MSLVPLPFFTAMSGQFIQRRKPLYTFYFRQFLFVSRGYWETPKPCRHNSQLYPNKMIDVNRKMRVTGLEPARLAAQEPKSCMSANSITPAAYELVCFVFGCGKIFAFLLVKLFVDLLDSLRRSFRFALLIHKLHIRL